MREVVRRGLRVAAICCAGCCVTFDASATEGSPVATSQGPQRARLALSDRQGGGGPNTGYARLPLAFEENRGQSEEGARFLVRGHDYQIHLAPDAIAMAVGESGGASSAETIRSVRLRFVGARADGRSAGEGRLERKANYFVGPSAAQQLNRYGRAELLACSIQGYLPRHRRGFTTEIKDDWSMTSSCAPARIRTLCAWRSTDRIAFG